MATYNLTLIIDSAILGFQSSDNLCIAKKVNGSFTTVFQDASVKPKRADQTPLLTSNSFEWTDSYRVFCSANYKHGMLVSAATNIVEIGFGQQTTYKDSQFADPKPAGHDQFENSSGEQSYEDSFLANQIPNTLHAAVELKVKSKWVPVYVDPDNHASTMDKQLTPLNEYVIFWDNRVQTSSMIDISKFHFPFIFSFDKGSKNKTIRFGYAVPDKPSPQEAAKFYPA
ncbi:hypothetical protein NW752_001671 [Fusarium irregulare]|uniref:Uncharacterized protein n=1 Tax=Fusarium irregulare TaxID=2494466 RepID=A0A9W8PUZ3_9HYPO|nr:hypothetical protein NW766_003832 [Fusarium irregulare]KAJ4026717.1 hypothetical protein NW752_001671 [Fusarium irregulare]